MPWHRAGAHAEAEEEDEEEEEEGLKAGRSPPGTVGAEVRLARFQSTPDEFAGRYTVSYFSTTAICSFQSAPDEFAGRYSQLVVEFYPDQWVSIRARRIRRAIQPLTFNLLRCDMFQSAPDEFAGRYPQGRWRL